MKKPKKIEMEECPKCGEEYNPEEDQLVECPVCGQEGCTKQCNPSGVGCMCIECEESEENESN